MRSTYANALNQIGDRSAIASMKPLLAKGSWDLRDSIIDAYTLTGQPAADRAAAGMTPAPTDTQGKFVGQVNVVNGRVDIQFGNDAHQDIFGETVSVTPYMMNGGTIVWRCGSAPAPAGGAELSGGGVTAAHHAPTIDTRYLQNFGFFRIRR